MSGVRCPILQIPGREGRVGNEFSKPPQSIRHNLFLFNMASFPTLIHCVFAAYLYGGPAISDQKYEPIPVPENECRFSAWVREGQLHLKISEQEVFIPVPLLKGRYRFQYRWGEDRAYLSAPGKDNWYQIPVRLGSADFY